MKNSLVCLPASEQMAIPSIFTPVLYGNRLLVDGGETRTIPAEDVWEMGADVVIVVDCSARLYEKEQLEPLVTIYDQTMRFHKVESNMKQLAMADLVIRPDFGDLTLTDFSQVEQMTIRGEKAAREVIPQLMAILDSLNISTTQQSAPTPARRDSFYVTDIFIQGEREASEKLVLKELDIEVPRIFNVDEIQTIVDRVYSLQLFERVTYQILPNEIGSKLMIKVTEKNQLF